MAEVFHRRKVVLCPCLKEMDCGEVGESVRPDHSLEILHMFWGRLLQFYAISEFASSITFAEEPPQIIHIRPTCHVPVHSNP
jgi:hypothetical protein